MNNAVQALADTGVSIWLDDLNRTILTNGEFKALTTDKGVCGVTSNPTIFATALSQGDAYDEQVRELAAKGLSVDDAVFEITTTDVANACDQLREIFDRTGGLDGRASIEVDPRLAADTAGTNEAAKKLWAKIDKPNLMIKIPATKEGLPAIAATLAEGISVNVTLIFSLERYRGVMNAFLEGLEQAKANGHDISKIRSVASFFVSRVDTEVDKRLAQIGTDEAKSLAGKAGIANARLAYQAYEEVFSTPRWQSLADAGAHTQRPLWASTGVKNPDYDDTMYVVQLAVEDTVNTMPPKTLEAVIDHGKVEGDQVTGHYADAKQVMDDLDKLGVDYGDVVELLEKEGVEKFEKSWAQLLDSVDSELKDKAAVK